MLVQFRVKNYRSILGEQTLEMSASAGYKELVDLNTFEAGAGEGLPRLLRSAVVYGPNASGKSNLVKALSFMRDRVINSAKESQANEEIDVRPFRLTPASRAGDSEFEVVFIEDGVRYQYGFRCDRSRFLEEWLYAFPFGRSQKWFHRVFNDEVGGDEFYFGTNFLGGRKRQDWREQTRANSLFLSTALQFNNEQLRPVLKWFQSRLVIIQGSNYSGVLGYTLSLCKDETQKIRVLEFINSADISISDIRLEDRLFSDDMLPKDFPMRDKFVELLDGKKGLRAMFMHDDVETGEAVPFDLEDESDGTRALFAFSGPWLDVVDNGRVLVVDELDSSLHPLMVRHLVNLLHHEGGKAQLVFTTHDTSLLSQKIFRRDQIWFMEKNEKSATELYPLADFRPRDNEAVERKYLNGRYGGIPFLKEMDFHGI